MAFLGSLIGGIGAVATAVAPVVSAYQAVSSLFRPAIQQPPTPHAWFGGGLQWSPPDYLGGDVTFGPPRGFYGMPRYRWGTPTVRAFSAAQVPMKSDWLGGGMWH